MARVYESVGEPRMNDLSLLLDERFNQLIEHGWSQLPGGTGLLFLTSATDVNAEHSESRTEVGHQKAGETRKAVDADLVARPQRVEQRGRKCGTFEQR